MLCGFLVFLYFVVHNLPRLYMHAVIFSPSPYFVLRCSRIGVSRCKHCSKGSQVPACLTCTNYPPPVPCPAVPGWLPLGYRILLGCTEPQLPPCFMGSLSTVDSGTLCSSVGGDVRVVQLLSDHVQQAPDATCHPLGLSPTGTVGCLAKPNFPLRSPRPGAVTIPVLTWLP